MSAVGLSASAALVVVFAVAAGGKVRSAAMFGTFAEALGQFGVPASRRRAVAAAVVAGELLVICWLVLPVVPAVVRLGPAVAVLAWFSLAIVLASRRHATLACHCFGSGGHTPVGPHLAVNAALIILGSAGVLSPTPATSAGARVLAIGLGIIVGAAALSAIPVLEAIGPRSSSRPAALPERI
ncbi:MAG: MauE/DoxX family redox-associated membrane protein [Pseudonocardiales bacterium]